ncbi:hypothetical protein K439DRAFT_1080539 [Ramaria rubella]|nr:hypothetical protein K439DRAFT_1080539 [Ramaria rubella]
MCTLPQTFLSPFPHPSLIFHYLSPHRLISHHHHHQHSSIAFVRRPSYAFVHASASDRLSSSTRIVCVVVVITLYYHGSSSSSYPDIITPSTHLPPITIADWLLITSPHHTKTFILFMHALTTSYLIFGHTGSSFVAFLLCFAVVVFNELSVLRILLC